MINIKKSCDSLSKLNHTISNNEKIDGLNPLCNDINTFNAKKQDIMQHKLKSKSIQDLLITYYSQENNKQNKIDALNNCGNYLLFKHYFDFNDTRQLIKINLCKNKLCPFCNYWNSRKQFQSLYTTVKTLSQEYNLSHLVLTIPNCSGKSLNNNISIFNKACAKFLRKHKIKGSAKSLEITYNSDNDTYHPHLHLIIINSSTLFSLKGKPPIDVAYNHLDTLRRDWHNCFISAGGKSTKTDYLKLYISGLKNSYKDVAELTKYILKFDKNLNIKCISILENQLKGVRKSSKTGILNYTHKDIKNQIKTNTTTFFEELESQYGFEFEEYFFNNDNYFLS